MIAPHVILTEHSFGLPIVDVHVARGTWHVDEHVAALTERDYR